MGSSFSLYIHIPFCGSFCDYCDFFSVKKENADSGYIDAFLKALVSDINFQLDYFDVSEIPTVYIGGGTPSVLGRQINVLFDALNKIPGFAPVEFSIEANPESVTEEFLAACMEGGVNRLSLGVQTLHEPSRRAVNRAGDLAMLEKRLALSSRFFPGNLSVDLITGLPYQSKKTVQEDIKRLLDFEPSHISLYSLSVESNTPLEQKIKTKQIKLPGIDEADSLWLAARDSLEAAGFNQYEVSNFAKDGKKCLHNIRYWRMEGWLGAGPAASGTVIDEKKGTAKRFTYAADIEAYIKSPLIQTAVCEELDRDALIKESLLMGFRYREGHDAGVFKKRFGCDVEHYIPKTLSRWKDRDLMLFLNSFLSEAFIELEEKIKISPY